MRASATRIFQPPDSAPTSPSIISSLKLRPAENFAGASFEGVAVQLLVARLHFAVALHDPVHVVGLVGIDHGRFELPQLGGNDAHRPGALHDLGDGAAALHLADILVEVADGDALIDGHLSFIGLLLSRDHPEKRRLAGAVRTDEPDAFASIERRGRLR